MTFSFVSFLIGICAGLPIGILVNLWNVPDDIEDELADLDRRDPFDEWGRR